MNVFPIKLLEARMKELQNTGTWIIDSDFIEMEPIEIKERPRVNLAIVVTKTKDSFLLGICAIECSGEEVLVSEEIDYPFTRTILQEKKLIVRTVLRIQESYTVNSYVVEDSSGKIQGACCNKKEELVLAEKFHAVGSIRSAIEEFRKQHRVNKTSGTNEE